MVRLATFITGHAALSASADDQFALIHGGEVDAGFVTPEMVKSQSPLITQHVVVVPAYKVL